MAKIVEYAVLSSSSTPMLERSIASWIGQGWQPFGGIAFNKIGDGYADYYQAMVKYEPSGPEEV